MNPEEIPAWEPFLKRSLLFRDLSTEDLGRVASRLKPLSLPRGATLYSRGDPGDAFYLVTSGQVRLLSERGGREVLTAFLGRGDALGELSLLTGEPHSVTVKLDTTSEFLVLSKKNFEEAVRENPSIMIHLSRIIAQRMLATQRALDPAKSQRQQVVAWIAALEPAARSLLTLHLALGLVEETRRRVLLMDLGPDCGSLARALGLKPVLTSEAMLREQDLRDPRVLRNLLSQHPSGLQILSMPPAVLGGRLYRGIFLFMNLLREHHDFVLAALGERLGDVEKSILEEADGCVLAGSAARLGELREAEGELRSLPAGPGRILRLWVGPLGPAEAEAARKEAPFLIPWPEALTAAYAGGVSPHQVLERFPKTSRAVRRLARRLGGRSIGLAMGAGAALGYSLIGILKGFKRAGIDVDLASGTSVGAFFGGLYAAGYEPEEIEEVAIRVDKAWVYENLFWDFNVAAPWKGFFAGASMHRFFRSYFGEREFQELELPFACVATDIESGESVVFREGKVVDAVRASCGIPLLFAPYHLNGRYLVDGGLTDPVPTRVLSQMGADILVSVNMTMPTSQRRDSSRRRGAGTVASGLRSLQELALPPALLAPNLLEVLFHMIFTMEYEIADSRLDLAHVVIRPDLREFSWTEFHRAREIIERGEKAAEEAAPKIRQLLPFFADHCRVPLHKPWKGY